VSINHRGIAPDIELERDAGSTPSPPPGASAAEGSIEQRDPDVKRAVQELKVPTVGGSGSVTAALRPR
jgi:C-terminal processing protease CtpA/Prc